MVGSDSVLLCPIEEEEGEDGDSCCALNIQESSCRETSVFVMGLSRNISFCDKAQLLGRIGRILASIWSVRLVSDQISLVLMLVFRVFLS